MRNKGSAPGLPTVLPIGRDVVLHRGAEPSVRAQPNAFTVYTVERSLREHQEPEWGFGTGL
jgi:hypothetical protein